MLYKSPVASTLHVFDKVDQRIVARFHSREDDDLTSFCLHHQHPIPRLAVVTVVKGSLGWMWALVTWHALPYMNDSGATETAFPVPQYRRGRL